MCLSAMKRTEYENSYRHKLTESQLNHSEPICDAYEYTYTHVNTHTNTDRQAHTPLFNIH